jgi:LuxR family transcriptional regulator, maltose regulon positive regulatory protein
MEPVVHPYETLPLQVTHKFDPPAICKAVPRERLFDLLDEASGARAVWICGPSGVGKTTLMASYLEKRQTPCVWYRSDEADADLAAFFHYLGRAVDGGLGPLSTHPTLPEYLPENGHFAIAFLEDVGRRFEKPVWIVFDNLKANVSEKLMRVLRPVVEQVPPGINLCMISRTGPPPALARAVANQAMAIIEWRELAFTPDECQYAIEIIASDGAHPCSASWLHRHTGGWACGVMLCLQQTVTERVLADFPEGVYRTFGHLAGKILSVLGHGWLDFLLQLSFLEEVGPERAARLTGIQEAGERLELLSSHTPLIDKNPGPGKTYRYQPLLRDCLRRHLSAKSNALKILPNLCRRVTAIMAESGSIDKKLRFYRLTEDWERLAGTILAQGYPLAAQGRHQVLSAWLSLLPPSVLGQHPGLILYKGLSLLHTEPLAARRCFQTAWSGFARRNDVKGCVLSWTYGVESFYLARAGKHDLTDWIQEGVRLNGLLPSDGDAVLCARLAQGMVRILLFEDRGAHLSVWLERCKRAMYHCPDLPQQLNSARTLVLAYCLRGEIWEASIIIDYLKTRSFAEPLATYGRLDLLFIEGLFHTVTGENRQCQSTSVKALSICSQLEGNVFATLFYFFSVYASLAAGNMLSARKYLKKIENRIPSTATIDLSHFQCLSAWEAYAFGDLNRALTLSEKSCRFAIECGWPIAVLISRLMHARILGEFRRWQEAEELIATNLREACAHGWALFEFHGWLALAELRMLQGTAESMREPLLRAFRISLARGVFAGHWALRTRLSELCQMALQFGIHEKQVIKFIHRNDLLPAAPGHVGSHWPFAVRLYIMGRHAIVSNEGVVSTSKKAPKKSLELLDLLICKGPQGIARKTAAKLLWPESSGDRALQSLKTTLHRLKKLLGHEQAITTRNGRLAISTQHCWVDAWHFEGLIDQSNSAEYATRKKRRLEEAIRFYTPPGAGADGSSCFCTSYADRLRAKYERAVLEMGRMLIEAGKPEEAASIYNKGLCIEESSQKIFRALQRLMRQKGYRKNVHAPCHCQEIRPAG